MADALISMVAEQFFSYVKEEFGLVVGVREEVGKLRLTLEIILGVLQDAERKQVKNNAVKVWLGELRDILYEADDVMDKWSTEMAVSRLHIGVHQVDIVVKPRSERKVLSYLLCSCFKHVTVRYDISHQIKAIGERLDDINAKRSHFGLVDSPSQDQLRLITSSIIDVSNIHGRDDDTKIIVSKLLSESSHQETEVQVVAIVGMGGFGKTTLAKLVFKEEGVVKNFEKRMWVCVSEPFDLFGVAKAIIEQVEGEVPRSTEWELMHQSLSKSVKGKQFLLILDDVWTKNPNHWYPLKTSLDGGAPGCRIIVTTRNEEVAKMMGSSYIHNLKILSEDDSWSLLRNIALKGRDSVCQKFEKVGKEIANKCKDVPLALSTLASLLCVKTTVQNWRDILASDLWGLPYIEDFFLPSLFLSYYSLPSVSKQCFLYCAVFPKDTKMEKDLLVKLWMAEGFLGSGRMGDLEKVGEDHFDNLGMRSFFQDFEKNSNGNVTSCKMRDLVHDFAQYLSHGECSNNAEFDCDKVRYLYLNRIKTPSLYKARKVRSVLQSSSLSVELFKLQCLRVLEFRYNYRYNDLEELPEAVEKLVHLRYLDLSGGEMRELPETMCNLYNLQTLILSRCSKLQKLPKEIGRLSNLRHLEMEYTHALQQLPQSIKRLSSLRTLSKFIVSQGCKIGNLKLLNNLRGALELKGLGEITDESDAIEADLKKKKDLCSLTFDWRGEENDVAAAIGMFERLEPHEDLEELKIIYYPGSLFPCWFGNNSVLGNIVNMELYRCNQITELPALGKLASLETLKIEKMGSVESIGREFYYGFDSSLGAEMIAFPKLKTLELWNMFGLENWELPIISKDTKIMPLLSKLKIMYCEELKALPCLGNFESLEELEIRGFHSIERVGISNYDESTPQVLFPMLRILLIRIMNNLEQWSVSFGANMIMSSLRYLEIVYCPRLRVLPDLAKFKSLVTLKLGWLDSWEGQTEEENVTNEKERDHSMPSCFTELTIDGCKKLKAVPSYLFSPTVKNLTIRACDELSGLQWMPPLIESLELPEDNGGFKELIELQKLEFLNCQHLDFELKELEHFTMLQDLDIASCPLLVKRFQGDDWRSILAHVRKITINRKGVTNCS